MTQSQRLLARLRQGPATFVCHRCSRSYISYERRIHYRSQFCSRECRYPQLLPVPIRLLQKRVIDRNGCWIWQGARTKHGYGQIRLVRGGNPVYVHRLSAMQSLGFIPTSSQWVLHRCDVKLCFNPAHLYLGTRNDNTKDAVIRGHTARVEQNGGARLTVNDVREIRALRRQGNTQQRIADKFGITQGQVSVIVSKKQWALVE